MPAYSGDVGRQCHLTLPVAMVQCRGAGEEEGWVAPVLYRLPLPQSPDQEGCLSLAAHARDHGKHGWCPALFVHGLEEWVLAS